MIKKKKNKKITRPKAKSSKKAKKNPKKIRRVKKIIKKKKISKPVKKKIKPKKAAHKKIKIKKVARKIAAQKKTVVAEQIKAPLDDVAVHQTKIRVIGIGGGGGSIISEIAPDVKRIDFVAANTDTKSLNELAKKVKRFQFGQTLTRGLGTGMNDEVGEAAALNEREKIKKLLEGQDLCIIVACLGGGTSSGATHVFAKISRSLGNLTYGIFTLPFEFEGEKKMEIAKRALEKIKPNLNAYSIIPNERIFQIIDKNTPLKSALSAINKKLAENLEGLIEMIYLPGLINIDFADLKTVLQGYGRLTYLNTEEIEEGPNREEAIKRVISTPLYPYTLKGARGILYNINGGKNLQLSEVSYISKIISESINKQAKIIFGIDQNSKYQDKIKITLLATGCNTKDFLPKTKQNPFLMVSTAEKFKSHIKHFVSKKNPSPPIIENKESLQKRDKTTKKNLKMIKPKTKKTNKAEKKVVKRPPVLKKKEEIKSSQQSDKQHKSQPLEKTPETEKVEVKVRRNGLQLKKAAEEEEKELLEQEEKWETPAILRKEDNK